VRSTATCGRPQCGEGFFYEAGSRVLFRNPYSISGGLRIGAFGRKLHAQADPLPSWHDILPRKEIVTFVEKITNPGSPDFVPVAERIATFDNDGTLWAEQPVYLQLLFAVDRVKALAPQHPEWKEQEPFASLLKGDVKVRLRAASACCSKSGWARTPA
jgi:hypothetical protein